MSADAYFLQGLRRIRSVMSELEKNDSTRALGGELRQAVEELLLAYIDPPRECTGSPEVLVDEPEYMVVRVACGRGRHATHVISPRELAEEEMEEGA